MNWCELIQYAIKSSLSVVIKQHLIQTSLHAHTGTHRCRYWSYTVHVHRNTQTCVFIGDTCIPLLVIYRTCIFIHIFYVHRNTQVSQCVQYQLCTCRDFPQYFGKGHSVAKIWKIRVVLQLIGQVKSLYM